MNQIEKLNNSLNNLSDVFSEQMVIPLIHSSYTAGGELLARTAKVFSASMEKRVRTTWVDPFSSKTLLRVFLPIENFSRLLAKRKPTQKPFFHFLDQSLISSAQHLFAYIKEANTLLKLPGNLKTTAKKMTFDHFIFENLKKEGRIFSFFSDVALKAKEVSLALLNLMVRVADLAFQCIFVTSEFELLGYLREIIGHARRKIHGKFSDLAVKAIDKHEEKIRKEIVANVATFTTHYVVTLANRIALKTALALMAYGTIESFAHSSFSVHKLSLQVFSGLTAGYLLWKNVYEPYLEEYYLSFREGFDPNRSYLKDFLEQHCFGYLYLPLTATKRFFCPLERVSTKC